MLSFYTQWNYYADQDVYMISLATQWDHYVDHEVSSLLTVCVFVCLFACLFVCLFVCLFDFLFVCIDVTNLVGLTFFFLLIKLFFLHFYKNIVCVCVCVAAAFDYSFHRNTLLVI